MIVVEHIKRIAENLGLSFRYGTAEELNMYADNTEMPSCFLYRVEGGDVQHVGGSLMRSSKVVFNIIRATSYEYNSEENDAVIAECEKDAWRMIVALFDDTRLTKMGNIELRNIYLEFSGFYSGVSVLMSVRENVDVTCVCNC